MQRESSTPYTADTPDRKNLAGISNQAFSIVNFRGGLIKMMVQRGVRVFALAPDPHSIEAVKSLGAIPVSYRLRRTGMNPLRDAVDMLRLAALLRRLKVGTTLGYFIKPVIYHMR